MRPRRQSESEEPAANEAEDVEEMERRYAVETKKIIARELTVAPRCMVTRYQCDGVG
jgi:hypothetical protein